MVDIHRFNSSLHCIGGKGPVVRVDKIAFSLADPGKSDQVDDGASRRGSDSVDACVETVLAISARSTSSQHLLRHRVYGYDTIAILWV